MDNINLRKNSNTQQENRIRVASRVGETIATHSYTQGEVHAFSQHLNNSLKDDPQLKSLLPINPESDQLFQAVDTGVLLCKLINKAQPNTISEKAINFDNLNIFKIKENINLAITSARAIGCICVNVHSTNILEKSEHIILDLSALSLSIQDRLKQIINDSKQLGLPPNCIKYTDIMNCNQKLNLIFTAHLFNNCPGLEPTEQEKVDAAELIDDDKDYETPREERVFRMWINSLNLEGVYINNLIQDLRDGEILCLVMDKLVPGKVDMKKVKAQLKNRTKLNKIQCANYAIQIAKELGCQLVGIGGVDIVNGNKKLILAIVWQLMKKQQLECIGDMTENQLIDWANNRIVDPQYKINNFRDKKLKSSHFFIKLLESIEPQIINKDFVTPGQNDQEVMENAKYVISVSRKLEAAVFIVWEHIVDINSKFLQSFVASLYRCALEYKKK
ncbi:hypothetical protein IMG5_098980 [Ichthyophthirius multifiliis]|uniref:Calponin-homology (CH) domain-containing protein n=1 Tax=Ichthyophthirius multifiliis TaxID=5932 RepID=G0QS32_ICHMU|nr:hypothetical protein IMG5_098980 [Ichthyophthirius multifiliis]EGR31974.1 hypothetical protein IMG5_098980 [Ichthyophthirius multifiliis]|eukprot:XP_004035460.1 hypothetical protein IMG5_098980 [Ichthyophthirius multifiliis]